MDALQKLQLLGPAAAFEPAEEVGMLGERAPLPQTPDELAGCISHATLPGGKRVPMLKTLVSSACERDCRYCPFRAGRDFRRATFTPDELANFTAQIYRQGLVKGVFLSSAILGGGPHTQDRIIATAELLRRKYQFTGYLHLKIMPGAERDQISAALQYADRLSVNLEAPNARRLADLAPHKHFSEELLQRLRWIHELRQTLPVRRPSITTQFVVGAVDETDVEILTTSAYLYRELGLARAYFSGFSPVVDTPLEHHPPIQLHREHRLYQASFLLRDYGFDVEELPFQQDGNLPLYEDPKIAWANQHLVHSPVELNTADREMLLRVPGIGPIGADRIIRARRQGTLHFLGDLSKLGIATKRAAPYILLNGRRSPQQLTFWTG